MLISRFINPAKMLIVRRVIMDFGGITILAITIIAYLVGMIARAVPLENKWIPCICGLCGMALGIAGLYIIPDFPANNWIDAAAVGIASGLAATGADQIYRQLHPSDKSRITFPANEDETGNG